MMLFYKAWRESQARFLWGALALALFCSFVWFRAQVYISLPGRPLSYVARLNTEVFGGPATLFFVLLVIFLGLGGLLRERAHHTAVFTLALPVSRAKLVGAQVAVGLIELVLLALVPAMLIKPLSALVHQTYPIADALRYGALRIMCGVEIFAISYLLSVVLRGEYTAPVACWIAVFLQTRINNWRPLHRYVLNPMATMNGRWDWNGKWNSINDPFPWMELSILMLIALVLLVVATRITERQNV